MNVPEAPPAVTFTVAGTVASFWSELFSETVAPDFEINPLNVTVPVNFWTEPPTIELADVVKLPREAGSIVMVADCVLEPRPAVTVPTV